MKLTDKLRNDLLRMGFKEDQINTATIHGKPLSEAEKTKPKQSDGWPGYKSKHEALYAMELDDRVASGEIKQWFYEPWTFKLTEPTVVEGKKIRAIKYTPDFVCWMADGKILIVEVKGYRRTKDINRYKTAKDKYRMFDFIMVQKVKGGWETIM